MHLSGKKSANRALLSAVGLNVQAEAILPRPLSPLSVRKRSSSKPTIQLDILSADRLMPARKVLTIQESFHFFVCIK